MNIANLITLSRLCLAVLLMGSLLLLPTQWQYINFFLMSIVLALDSIDGLYARWKSQETQFGAIFDIATDRITEMLLWVTFSYLKLIPIWIIYIVIVRGVLVDSFRNSRLKPDQTPFELTQDHWSDRLISSSCMRYAFGTIKYITFLWLTLRWTSDAFLKHWFFSENLIHIVTILLISITLSLSILRGLPVIIWPVNILIKYKINKM